jgi:hypothetical protein
MDAEFTMLAEKMTTLKLSVKVGKSTYRPGLVPWSA